MTKLPLWLLGLLTGLCATSAAFAGGSKMHVDELGDNTFAVTRQASTAFNRDVEELTSEAKQDAQQYCAQRGKELKVLAIDVDKPKFGLGYVSVKLKFKALDAGDAELANTAPVMVTDVRKHAATPVATTMSPTNDLYNDLLKLDDLRKKGILTDDEFQAEKKKVLNRSK